MSTTQIEIDYNTNPPTHGKPVYTRQYVRNVYGEFSYWGGIGPWVQTFYYEEFEVDEETGEKVKVDDSHLGTRQYKTYTEAISDFYDISLV